MTSTFFQNPLFAEFGYEEKPLSGVTFQSLICLVRTVSKIPMSELNRAGKTILNT